MKDGRSKYLVIAVAVSLCLVGISIGIGYIIGRAVKTKEFEDAQKSEVKGTVEKNVGLHKEAVNDVSTSNLRENLRYFTRQPHSPGSKESYDLALYIKEKWLKYGFDKVELKKYNVLLSVPEKAGVITVKYANGSQFYQTQPVDASMDPAYNDSRVFPPFGAFSPAGSVTGKLVFANYGRTSDYSTLKANNISVAGKIVITRFGKSSRVVQHGRAHRNGAIGLIMYMDPEEYAKQGVDKVYPEYNWMPKNGVQRGTLKYSPVRGDPLTPGYPAVDGIYRLSLEEAKKDLPQIPVQPISYGDAEPLLRMLKGDVGKGSDWQGALPFTYGVEMEKNDNRNVTLTVNTALKAFDIYNVIGTITGTVEPDHLVLLGNHRDAWIYGAADASSGTSAMMETSRVIGNMLKKGWKPRRSLVFCSWGAEEPQLMGSAEWMEDYARLLHRRAVAYLNVDMSVDGAYSFRAKSMPSMDWILFEATKKIQSPYNNETVYEEWKRKIPDTTSRYDVKGVVPSTQTIKAGSDYAVFYQRLGIPCVDIRYTYDRKTSGNPLYHSIYDNFHMMSKLIDPTFKFHQVTTRAWTQIALDMADSFIIPLNATHYAYMLKYYRRIFWNKFKKDFEANGISFEHVDYAIGNFSRVAEEFQSNIDKADLRKQSYLYRINSRLVNLERAFIDDSIISPPRPFQRHVILTPSVRLYYYLMGGVVEAIYDAKNGGSWEGVKKQVSAIQYAIQSASHLLDMSPI